MDILKLLKKSDLYVYMRKKSIRKNGEFKIPTILL